MFQIAVVDVKRELRTVVFRLRNAAILRSNIGSVLIKCLAVSLLVIHLATFANLANADAQSFVPTSTFGTELDATVSVAVGDMDNDGDLDIVAGRLGQSAVIFNDAGNFERSVNLGSPDYTSSVAVGDIDNDGDLDVVLGNNNQKNKLFFNEHGTFTAVLPLVEFPGLTTSVAIGDVDGNNELDIVAGNGFGESIVYLNFGVEKLDAQSSFTQTIAFGAAYSGTNSIALGDIDGINGLDIVVGNRSPLFSDPQFVFGQNAFYPNGSSDTDRFTTSIPFGTSNDDTKSVALGNLNSDAILDIVVGNYDGQNVVYFRQEGGATIPRFFGTGNDKTNALALGDMDGDGDLDIVAANDGQNAVYLNVNGDFTMPPQNFGSGTDYTSSVAVGDMDGDGDLDIVAANYPGRGVIYSNAGHSFSSINTFIPYIDSLSAVAVGDMGGDSGLDIVALGGFGENVVLINEGNGYTATIPFGIGNHFNSIALGDIDGKNGTIDIVVGNYEGQNRIFLNDGLTRADSLETIRPFGTGNDKTNALALGDMDGDGDLDIVAANDGQNAVYLNVNGDFTMPPRSFGSGTDYTSSVAVGDMDGDGDLDIVAANRAGKDLNTLETKPAEIAIYENKDGRFVGSHRYPLGNILKYSLALADIDGDGDLDVVLGAGERITSGQSMIFTNENGYLSESHPFGAVDSRTESIATGDIDGDGDLDIVTGEIGQSKVYWNVEGDFSTSSDYGTFSAIKSVHAGDMTGDGDLDITGYSGDRILLFSYDADVGNRFRPSMPGIRVSRPIATRDANFYSTPVLLDNRVIPITFRMMDPESITVRFVRVCFSVDGGDNWQLAVPEGKSRPSATEITQTGTNCPYVPGWESLSNEELRTSPGEGTQYTFFWDTFSSGFWGQSDNVVIRIEAYPSLRSRPNSVPGPYMWPYTSATTFPFRVRGTQVRVESGDVAPQQPVPDSIVFRLPEGKNSGALPLSGVADHPFQTDFYGYLQGRGRIILSDTLVALAPSATPFTVTHTVGSSVRLYNTNAVPVPSGLSTTPVTQGGVQTLTVSSANPLLLFDLSVALEWDARNDSQFMEQLRFNLKRTSQLLYDWTDGQAALGNVRIYHDARRNNLEDGFNPWTDSHIRIYSSNRIRPSAAEGGIISPTLELTETVNVGGMEKVLSYTAGQVQMGAVWNRYGEPSGTLGEDWPRALAHELGHYLFFLEDNYLGLDEQGLLITVPTAECPGVMNDPYQETVSEFHPQANWDASGCTKTLSQQSAGRSDWETIQHFYPLHAPSTLNANPGPAVLPLEVTSLEEITPGLPANTVPVPIYYLLGESGYLPGLGARAYLFQGDWITDLGQPTLDQVQAWGARPGDRLCVFDTVTSQQGCEQIAALDDQLDIASVPAWQPEIVVSPVNSTTIGVEVTGAPVGGTLHARLYPSDAPAAACISLMAVGNNRYSGTFTSTEEPTLDGFVHVWVQQGINPNVPCSEPKTGAVHEVVTGFAVGGNPVHRRARLAPSRSGGVHRRARLAPVMSADGQVIVTGEELDTNLDEEWFFTLQATAIGASIPPGRTLVGQAYRLSASPNAPSLTGTSISFGYLGAQVPPGEEGFLRIYYREENPARCPTAVSPCWRPLKTFKDTLYNVASAKTVGPGVYALMSSTEIPLSGPGWNLFAYPIQESQPVSTALASIDGLYNVVWGFTSQPPIWQSFSPKVVGTRFEELVNDLKQLTFGMGYWIYLNDEAASLFLSGSQQVGAASVDTALPLPPATYYGDVLPTDDFLPVAGQRVEARIGDKLCAQGVTQQEGARVIYALDVPSDNGGSTAGCGALGRWIRFNVNGVPMVIGATWNNTDIQELPLLNKFTDFFYLPVIQSAGVSMSEPGDQAPGVNDPPTAVEFDHHQYLPSASR